MSTEKPGNDTKSPRSDHNEELCKEDPNLLVVQRVYVSWTLNAFSLPMYIYMCVYIYIYFFFLNYLDIQRSALPERSCRGLPGKEFRPSLTNSFSLTSI